MQVTLPNVLAKRRMGVRTCPQAGGQVGKGDLSLMLHTKRDVQGKPAESALFASKPVTEQQESMRCIQPAWPRAQLANFTPVPRGILGKAARLPRR